jgi:uncharacterized DUF497 family protein
MVFEYDQNKSHSNKRKHGIDFEEAQRLWSDPNVFMIPSLQKQDEERFLVFGKIEKRHYTAIVTFRGEALRSISVRRSRKKEIEYYESNPQAHQHRFS